MSHALGSAPLSSAGAVSYSVLMSSMPWTRNKSALRIALVCAALLAAAGQRAVSEDTARLVDIGGGRKMYVECRGTSSPTVVLVAGLKASADDWNITKEIGRASGRERGGGVGGGGVSRKEER